MTRRDMTICDGCGRQAPTDETVGWWQLHQRRGLFDMPTLEEEEQATRHFCELACVASVVPTSATRRLDA